VTTYKKENISHAPLVTEHFRSTGFLLDEKCLSVVPTNFVVPYLRSCNTISVILHCTSCQKMSASPDPKRKRKEQSTQRFDGKVAIVTGGASGIGLATVERLAQDGANVSILDINQSAGKEVGGWISVALCDYCNVL